MRHLVRHRQFYVPPLEAGYRLGNLGESAYARALRAWRRTPFPLRKPRFSRGSAKGDVPDAETAKETEGI